MYELRCSDTNELVSWSAFPDQIKRFQRRSIYHPTYIVFNPNSVCKD